MIKKINGSQYENIYVCGDIHGCFSLLEQKLLDVNFNKDKDLLVCTGDLIDRGPESHLAPQYIAYNWFESVLGNHEDMCINNPTHYHYVEDQDAFIAALESLPLAITISLPNSLVGVIHAAVPGDYWNSLEKLTPGDPASWGFDYCIWDRNDFNAANPNKFVSNIDHVYFGHNIVKEITTVANKTYLDTGAWVSVLHPKVAKTDGYDLTLLKIK